jgi:antitoxin ParD1/3/4
MRTNIEIDDDIMQAAMRGSEFKTKKDAVEAGLKLLARQAHYREVLKWEGKLHWDDQPEQLAAIPNVVMKRQTPDVIAPKAKAAMKTRAAMLAGHAVPKQKRTSVA